MIALLVGFSAYQVLDSDSEDLCHAALTGPHILGRTE